MLPAHAVRRRSRPPPPPFSLILLPPCRRRPQDPHHPPLPLLQKMSAAAEPNFFSPRAFLLHQITPRRPLLYSLSGATCQGHIAAVKSRPTTTTNTTSSVSTPPAFSQPLSHAPHHFFPTPVLQDRAPLRPPVPNSTAFPPTGCSGELPLPSACQAGSLSPPCASSPPVSPCRARHHTAQSAHTRGDRSPRDLPRQRLGPALATGPGRAHEAVGQK
jgi:hypothetical protein